MRTYRQYCSLARALDVLGDRWTLLIVRELLLRGPSRYTDLRDGLPGIATNLLAARLRELEAAGVLAREDAPPPVASTLFSLTERGRALEGVVRELCRWGLPLMVDGPSPGDAFRSRWISLPVDLFLGQLDAGEEPLAIEVRTGDGPVVIESDGGAPRLRAGSAESPDAVLSGPPKLILALLVGELDLDEAERRGLRCEGSRKSVARLLRTRAAAT